jgi:hypothetical protein
MRLAAVLFLAAAAFAAAVIAGVIELEPSRPAPPAIVVGDASRHVARPATGGPVRRTPHAAVRQKVEKANMSRYPPKQARGQRP